MTRPEQRALLTPILDCGPLRTLKSGSVTREILCDIQEGPGELVTKTQS